MNVNETESLTLPAENLVKQIVSGARVTILDRFGRRHTGRAVMRAAPQAGPGAWVLNMGGAHGTPGIATAENVVKVGWGK